MYKSAYSYEDETIFYYDGFGNKYIAKGGGFAWRINNPGLVRSHSHFVSKNGSIGSCRGFAIFSHPAQGRKALIDLLNAKKYFNSTLKAIAKLYDSKNPDRYFLQLISHISVCQDKKISAFSKEEFQKLLVAIEKLCGYTPLGNENFTAIPRIYAHIESNKPPYEGYLIAGNVILSKQEVIEWITTHRLDGIIVHQKDGKMHVRSRPSYLMRNIHITEEQLSPLEGKIDTLIRSVGEKIEGQCIWGFINGIWNAREDALQSALSISTAANGEQVLSMPNDMLGWVHDLATCAALKINFNTPIIQLAVKFFRYLLSLSKQNTPIIVFAHSMGAIICEHALELLTHEEQQAIRIFTFGGGSFIRPGKSHFDSHNFASANDLVCLLGSPNLRTLAMRRYLGFKEGLTQEQIINRWAEEDALLHLDTSNTEAIENYKLQQRRHIEKQLESIRNVTIINSGSDYEHSFSNACYQKVVKEIIERYREKRFLSEISSVNLMTYVTV